MDIDISEIFSDYFEQLVASLPKIMMAIIILIVSYFIGKTVYKIISRLTQTRWQDKIMSNFISQIIKFSIYLFGVILAFNVIGYKNIASTIFAGAGVSAIVIGFAFKDIAENFLAGIILTVNRPFEIGDIIESGGDKGTVKDLDLRSTHLRNSAGKDIYIPNSSIIKNTLTNYTTDGFLRLDFMIGIAPESDIEETRRLINDYLFSNENVLKTPPFSIIVKELGESTINIMVLFWVDILSKKKLPDNYLGHSIKSKVITDVKTILDQNNIAMPSQVLEHKMYGHHKFKVEGQVE